MKHTKIISLFLIAVLMLAVLASCGNGSSDASSAESKDSSSTAATSTQLVGDISDYVEKKNYQGQVFHILASGTTEPEKVSSGFLKNNYPSTFEGEMVPDKINEAFATRNSLVEEYLNIEIRETYIRENTRMGGPVVTKVREEMIAGADDTYSIIHPSLYDLGTLTAEGALVDLASLSDVGLNINNPWWNQKFIKDVMIGGRLYFVTGDINKSGLDSTPIVAYNKNMLIELGHSEDMYEVVREGNWTFDMMISLAKLVETDSNGDGVQDFSDRNGWLGQADDTWNAFYGAGQKIMTQEDDGTLSLTMYNDKTVAVFDKMIDMFQDKNHYVSANDYFEQSPLPVKDLSIPAFLDSRALFFTDSLGTTYHLKNMPDATPYGVLPIPKLDADQEGYQSFQNPWVCAAIAIPSNIKDEKLSFVATVLECMGYYSTDTLRRDYVDEVLQYQNVQDDDSYEMLMDYIIGTTGCDIGNIFQIGGFPSVLHSVYTMTPGSFTSIYETNEALAESQIEKLMDNLSNIN